jgi:hypothetical protein
MCLWVIYKKNCFASLKSLKKGLRSGVGSGSVVRGAELRIQTRTKLSRIPNTAWYGGWWLIWYLIVRTLVTGSNLCSNPDILQLSLTGDISKAVANTLQPAQQNISKDMVSCTASEKGLLSSTPVTWKMLPLIFKTEDNVPVCKF